MIYELKRIFTKSIRIILLIMMLFVLYYSLFSTDSNATYFYKYFENRILIIIVSTIILAIYILKAFFDIEKMHFKNVEKMNKILLLGIIFLQIIIIVNFDITPITDNYMVNDQALMLAYNQNTKIDTNIRYFSIYGNNNFMVIIMSMYYKLIFMFGITNYRLAGVVLNTILIDSAIIFTYKISDKILGKRKACKILLLCFINPLTYVLIPWVYTCTFSIPFFMGILYYAICLYNNIKNNNSKYKRYFLCAVIALMTIIGYYIRPTAIISLIAVFIGALCWSISSKGNIKRIIPVMTMFFIIAIILNCFVKLTIDKYSGDKSNYFPVTHWIMMGLHEDGKFSAKDEKYTASFKTYEEKIEGNINEIKKTINEYKLSGLIKHFGKKLKVTWTDGTCGYNVRMVQDTKFTKLYNYIVTDKVDVFIVYCQVFRVLTYMFITIYLFLKIKTSNKFETIFIIELTLFGAILFYLIWESKSAYSIPFIFILNILMQQGAEDLLLKLKKINKFNIIQKSTIKHIGFILMFFSFGTIIMQYNNYTKVKIEKKDYVVNEYTNEFVRWIESDKSNVTKISQEFYSNKNFNTIEIKCKNINNNNKQYKIYLENSIGEKINSWNITNKNIDKNGFIKLSFNNINPTKNEKYKLIIENKDEVNLNSIAWAYRYSKISDNYKGNCTVYNEVQPYDIYIRVYNKYYKPYFGKGEYLIFAIVILMLEYSAIIILNRSINKM